MAQRPGGVRDLEERALAEAADGRLVPLVQRFALAQAAAAHKAIEARATVGKTCSSLSAFGRSAGAREYGQHQ